LINWIKHADQFNYVIFVCRLQHLLTSSVVHHIYFEFEKRLNAGQRILENMNHKHDESDQHAMPRPFLPQIWSKGWYLVRWGILHEKHLLPARDVAEDQVIVFVYGFESGVIDRIVTLVAPNAAENAALRAGIHEGVTRAHLGGSFGFFLRRRGYRYSSSG
jgi:hypothetical protein